MPVSQRTHPLELIAGASGLLSVICTGVDEVKLTATDQDSVCAEADAVQGEERNVETLRSGELKIEKRNYFKGFDCWLGNLDSNQDKQSQSLLCYRYTIPHRSG